MLDESERLVKDVIAFNALTELVGPELERRSPSALINMILEPDTLSIYSPTPDWASSRLFVMFVILYSTATVLSASSNLLILFVLMRPSNLRSVTNLFLANITVANLIYTCCAPFQFWLELSANLNLPALMCKLLPVLSTTSINLNTFTMIAASLECYVVIVFPFRPKLSRAQCLLIIAFIWLLSVAISLPWTFIVHQVSDQDSLVSSLIDQDLAQFDYQSEMDNLGHSNGSSHPHSVPIDLNATIDRLLDESSMSELSFDLFKAQTEPSEALLLSCSTKKEATVPFRLYIALLSAVQYILPVTVLCVAYSNILYYSHRVRSRLSLNATSTEQESSQLSARQRNKRKLIKMLLLIIVCFSLCWFPLQLNALVYAISPKFLTSRLSPESLKIVWLCTHLLAFSHFCYNPFLNCLINRRFKKQMVGYMNCCRVSCLFKCHRSDPIDKFLRHIRLKSIEEENRRCLKSKGALQQRQPQEQLVDGRACCKPSSLMRCKPAPLQLVCNLDVIKKKMRRCRSRESSAAYESARRADSFDSLHEIEIGVAKSNSSSSKRPGRDSLLPSCKCMKCCSSQRAAAAMAMSSSRQSKHPKRMVVNFGGDKRSLSEVRLSLAKERILTASECYKTRTKSTRLGSETHSNSDRLDALNFSANLVNMYWRGSGSLAGSSHWSKPCNHSL
nr:G protein-coupled receptor [Proales similis]